MEPASQRVGESSRSAISLHVTAPFHVSLILHELLSVLQVVFGRLLEQFGSKSDHFWDDFHKIASILDGSWVPGF